jgi:hypothetical protein
MRTLNARSGSPTFHLLFVAADAQCVHYPADIATLDTLRGRGMRVIEEEAEHLLRGVGPLWIGV